MQLAGLSMWLFRATQRVSRESSTSGLSPRASYGSVLSQSGNLARGNLFEGLRGLPQSGRSCSEVESELHVARGEIECNKVTGGVTVMAVVEYHAVRRCRF